MNEWLRRVLFLPIQGSTVAEDIDALHYFVILVTMGGATLVTLVGAYFILRYRRRTADPHHPHPDAVSRPPMSIEIGAILGLVGLFLLWWFIGARQFVRLRVAPADSMDIYVTAKQWMWKFSYPRGNRTIATLYVPAGRPVKLVMTSRDVIHSFFVPDFRIKQDVLPGRYTTVWFEAKAPGRYEILCTEYCGNGHSVMRGEVIALTPAEFDEWQEGESPAPDRVAGPVYVPPALPGEAAPPELVSLVREGQRAAAEQGCLRCHSTDGTPHLGPTWAGMYGAIAALEGGSRVVVDEAYITESMMDPRAKLHAGFTPLMPSYLGRIRPPETAAIIEYIKSLRDVRPEPGARERAGCGAACGPTVDDARGPREDERQSP